MNEILKLLTTLVVALAISTPVWAQEGSATADDTTPAATDADATADTPATAPAADDAVPPAATDEANPPADDAARTIGDVVEKIEHSEQAQGAKTNVLQPIYWLAETFSFPAFYWLAFAVMVTGVVSYALQLVLAKLAVLSKLSLSPTEVLSDVWGLVVSVIGLVLTTQAATENSTFTSSAFSVLSATGVGTMLGIVFYVWGQRQELEAAEGRRRVAANKAAPSNQQAHT